MSPGFLAAWGDQGIDQNRQRLRLQDADQRGKARQGNEQGDGFAVFGEIGNRAHYVQSCAGFRLIEKFLHSIGKIGWQTKEFKKAAGMLIGRLPGLKGTRI